MDHAKRMPTAANWSAGPSPARCGGRGEVMSTRLDAIYEAICIEWERFDVAVPPRGDALLAGLAWRVRVLCEAGERQLLPLGSDVFIQALSWRSDWSTGLMGEWSS